MPDHGSPTVRRRRLAGELHRLRDLTGLTGDQVAEQLGWSPSKISRIENARSGVGLTDARSLLNVYGVEGTHRDALLALTRDASRKGWWEAYSDSLPEAYSFYIGLEAEARSVQNWESQVVPGLLQTEAYAHAVIRTWQAIVTIPPSAIDRRVETRLARQKLLTSDPPLELTAVIDESVLRRRFGDDSIMRHQLEHLVEISQLPNVTVKVLPLAGPHIVGTGGFALLKFPQAHHVGGLHDIVCIEKLSGSLYVEDEVEVYHYHLAFSQLVRGSLEAADSRHLVSEIDREVWT